MLAFPFCWVILKNIVKKWHFLLGTHCFTCRSTNCRGMPSRGRVGLNHSVKGVFKAVQQCVGAVRLQYPPITHKACTHCGGHLRFGNLRHYGTFLSLAYSKFELSTLQYPYIIIIIRLDAHISTLLGVQGAVKPKTKQKTKHNTKKNRHNKISHQLALFIVIVSVVRGKKKFVKLILKFLFQERYKHDILSTLVCFPS